VDHTKCDKKESFILKRPMPGVFRFLPQEDLMHLLGKRSEKHGQRHHQAAKHCRQSG
jgi:hypothetical protein